MRVITSENTANFRELLNKIENWVNTKCFFPNKKLGQKNIINVSFKILKAKFQKLHEQSNIKVKNMSPRELHKFRINIKETHYIYGFFIHLVNKKNSGNIMKLLKKLQNSLGVIHDYYQASNMIKSLSEKHNQGNEYFFTLGEISGWKYAEILKLKTKMEKEIKILYNIKSI